MRFPLLRHQRNYRGNCSGVALPIKTVEFRLQNVGDLPIRALWVHPVVISGTWGSSFGFAKLIIESSLAFVASRGLIATAARPVCRALRSLAPPIYNGTLGSLPSKTTTGRGGRCPPQWEPALRPSHACSRCAKTPSRGAIMRNQRLAVGLMIVQAILFAVETAMIHHIGPRASAMQLALLRGGGGLMLVGLLAWKGGWSVLKTNQLPLQLLRGSVSVFYLWVLMYSFARMPFADATAISYTVAAYIAVFSALILNERVTPLQWTATAIGSIGALFIVKPAFLDRNIVYLIALFGTSFNGLAFVLNKYLQRPGGDSELTTMFYVNAVAVICNLPVLATTALPERTVWPWLSGVLIFGPVGMYAGIVAVRYASASSLGPYTLLRLVISLIGGVVLFHEFPNFLSLLGVVAILSSCLLAVQPAPRVLRAAR
jgi:drug/metabolite transporter (DMT)-like permease